MNRLFSSNSPEETVNFGARLSKYFLPGTVVALMGNLGSGKTTLIQGFAKGLGVSKGQVKSPTFVLFHIYKGRFPVYHFDLYRLEKAKELEDIGLEEFLSDRQTVSVVEWAERALSALPKDQLLIRLTDHGRDRRSFYLRATGRRSQKILRAFLKHEHSRH